MNLFDEDYESIRQLLVNHRIYAVLPEANSDPVVSCTLGSGPGDNYMSIVKRLKIPIEKSPETTEQSYVSLIVKRPPTALRLFRVIDVFRNEIHAYNVVLPYLRKFLHSPAEELIFPECFFAGQDSQRNDLIILEDLAAKEHFKPFNRELVMDLDFCRAVMKQLAKFHACSLIAKASDAEGFRKQCDSVLDVVYSPEAESLYTKLLRTSCAIALFSLIKSNADNSLNEPINLLRRLYGKVFKCMRQCVIRADAEAEARNVICHGDLWVNNIMVNKSDIKFIDFQAMRYGSPIFDILTVLYTGTRRQLREDHIETILGTYCSTMTHILQQSSLAPHELENLRDLFSLNNFMDAYKRSIVYGLGVAMWILPAVTFDSANLPNLDEIAREPCSDEQIINHIKGKLTERYHVRMKETILEFYENGRLQALVEEMQTQDASSMASKLIDVGDDVGVEIYTEVEDIGAM